MYASHHSKHTGCLWCVHLGRNSHHSLFRASRCKLRLLFLGHGRRHTFQGVPQHFATQVQGVDLPVTQTGWISYVPSIAVPPRPSRPLQI
jgi:hypothetical protein